MTNSILRSTICLDINRKLQTVEKYLIYLKYFSENKTEEGDYLNFYIDDVLINNEKILKVLKL